MSGRITALRLALATLLGGLLAFPAQACPPSLSIERPSQRASRVPDSAFVLVHAARGCQIGPLSVSGSAEGLVGGERRTITLDVTQTATPGVYQIRRTWPSEGVWVLRVVVTVGEGHATALVGVNAAGNVTSVREPGRRGSFREYGDADVEAMLNSLAH